MRIAVAIDGPAGAGKSTIAKLVGKKFNLMYINTGAMYRAVALVAKRNNISSSDINSLMDIIDEMEMHFENDDLILNGVNIQDEITMPEISEIVSEYASIPEVRKKLVALQRKMSEKYDVIMDGRDIGTVVLKDSKFKFFLTATPEERARRRYSELKNRGIDVDYNKLLDDIIKRDYIDSNRETDPLRKAEDAKEIDSSNYNITEVTEIICNLIQNDLK
ncbi:(d)CMP kinase [Clostridium celatum]|uniref:Cytidylate kinase n=1 Tax=Clostridium celatum DSM 1785 TaxID=545697 RepID=L1Q8S9_9CLOT|nr:(d)CMP kinase [Clostridium celatum]EKY24032.1 cytidylate kinase [Clostridium celatum DSM 1785]MCE9655668.1 (d)CMP kinase [Clostridium celatum]MDU3724878.1 (d)CMP kinase [Clostridium celatum]MDU6295594.1 (d)CMP kinase [Clostridium celatum]MDY3362235.1 (d)CMP kinase [Clostridium celatum]